MQIKTYKAATMKTVLSKIKTEMGPDAVILSSREIQDSSFGTLSNPLIEVTAAVDYDENLYQKHISKQQAEPIIDLTELHREPAAVETDIAEMKLMIQQLVNHSGLEIRQESPLTKELQNAGIQDKLVEMITSKLNQDADLTTVQNMLMKLIKTDAEPKSRIWTFMGTTGVGKTTTVAKLAARAVLKEQKDISIITLDTYRIGAVEQSRTYAKILGVPFYSVTTPEEFHETLGRLREKDLVLVDTVGRSALSKDFIDQMHLFFDEVPMTKFLLLPVATREKEMERITRNFKELGIDRMIFTKTDEALNHGSIINHNLTFRIPISHLTVGQRVPEDLEIASAKSIIDISFGA